MSHLKRELMRGRHDEIKHFRGRTCHQIQACNGLLLWKAFIVLIVIFVINSIIIFTHVADSNTPLLPIDSSFQSLHRKQPINNNKKNSNDEQEPCPDFGCPIYPAEITPYFHELLTDIFLKNQNQEMLKNFTFGSNTMASLTQKGKSHFYNQDRSVVVAPFQTVVTPGDEYDMHSSFLVGVFDGHGRQGHIVADYVAKDFPERFAKELNSMVGEDFGKSEESIDQAIVRALNKTLVEVDIYAPPNFLLGGCTATVTLRRGSKLYIANVGDSQTVLVSVNDQTKDEPNIVYMSRKDKASIPEERDRIIALGGKVNVRPDGTDSRVIAYSVAERETIALAMSRSLGDWEWKPIGVIAEPLIDIIDLKNHPNSFLIAASDGIWDLRRREFYAKQFQEAFYGDTKKHPLWKCWEVIQEVTPKLQTGYRDDMTAIIMKLS